MSNKIMILAVVFLFFKVALAQEKKDSIRMNLNLTFREKPLELNKEYISENRDSLQITAFKFYISNLKLEYSDKTKYSEPNSYHLIDIENPSSCQIPITNLTNKIISKVSFAIGIDSLTSVSGALEGVLDPAKGMYWAWQSGYINMKLEGRSSSCKTRKNEFHFHIGGYLAPNYAVRTIEFDTKNAAFEINVDLAKFFEQIKLSEINSIMIPGAKAMDIADKTKLIFTLSESYPIKNLLDEKE